MKNRKSSKHGDIATKTDSNHGVRLDSIEKSMTRIFDKLSDHEMRLIRIEENMATKQDLTRIYETQDKILEIVTRNDHELVMLKHVVEEHDDAIRQIKPILGLV